MMKKLSGRQYFDNFYYKTKYYLPDSCFIIILPKTAPLATDKAFQSTAVPSIATSAVQYAYRYTYKVLPESNNIKATGIMMTGLFFPYLPIVYPIGWDQILSPDTYRDDSPLASRGSYGDCGRACPIVVRYQKQLCAAIE